VLSPHPALAPPHLTGDKAFSSLLVAPLFFTAHNVGQVWGMEVGLSLGCP
jgi:hypothetical protein